MCLRSLVDWLILAPRDGKRSAERKLLCFMVSVLYSSTQNLSKKFRVQDKDILSMFLIRKNVVCKAFFLAGLRLSS